MRYYIAGPYRHPSPLGIALNVARAAHAWNALTDAGHFSVCPHTQSAPLDGDSPRDDDFWLQYTMTLMRMCDGVVMLPGWEKSEGSVAEVTAALELGMEVVEIGDLLPGYEVL